MTDNTNVTPRAASPFDLGDLIAAAKEQAAGHQGGEGGGRALPPVHLWHPENCGDMDLVIKADGSWWHEGSPIGRPKLVRLFSTILRHDDDGRHYLVTPGEKIGITVERAPFVAVRVDIEGEGKEQRLFFTTNIGDVVEAGLERPLRVETDAQTQEPSPFILVRARLEALIARPVFYELVEHATPIETPEGPQLGVYSNGMFFPLGPAGV